MCIEACVVIYVHSVSLLNICIRAQCVVIHGDAAVI